MPINQPQFIFHQHPPIIQQQVPLPNYNIPPETNPSFQKANLTYYPPSNFEPPSARFN